jgi:hypothetical protein
MTKLIPLIALALAAAAETWAQYPTRPISLVVLALPIAEALAPRPV